MIECGDAARSWIPQEIRLISTAMIFGGDALWIDLEPDFLNCHIPKTAMEVHLG
jgi:hypothetical protein